MIKFNQAMKQFAASKYEQNGQAVKALFVFSGTPPTKAQILSTMNATGNLSLTALRALGTLRLSNVYSTAVTPVMLNASLQSWQIAKLNQDFTVHSPGPANWFIFMLCSNNMNSPTFTTNSDVYQAYIGTVGDIGEDVDMELLTGIIESDMIYATNDIEVLLK